jgi:hypothetical protein
VTDYKKTDIKILEESKDKSFFMMNEVEPENHKKPGAISIESFVKPSQITSRVFDSNNNFKPLSPTPYDGNLFKSLKKA